MNIKESTFTQKPLCKHLKSKRIHVVKNLRKRITPRAAFLDFKRIVCGFILLRRKGPLYNGFSVDRIFLTGLCT